jgi:hypothetical protein
MRPCRSRAKAFPSREIGVSQIEAQLLPVMTYLGTTKSVRRSSPRRSKSNDVTRPTSRWLPERARGGIAGFGVSEWNKVRNISFHGGADLTEVEMRKFLAVMTVALVIAGFTIDSASARHHHRHGGLGHWFSMRGLSASNAELRGNNGNSASGSNSLANPNNTAGAH